MERLGFTVAGGCHLDRHLRFEAHPVMGRTNPVSVDERAGGVAANIARHLAARGQQVRFIGVQPPSVLAAMEAHLTANGMSAKFASVEGDVPGYTALVGPDGDLLIGAAALSLYDVVRPDHILPLLASSDDIFVIDANFPVDVLLALAERMPPEQSLYAAATALRKVDRLAALLPRLDAIVLNRAEAERLASIAEDMDGTRSAPTVADLASSIAQKMRHGGAALVSDGGGMAALACDGVVVTASPPRIEVVNANGAGDAMAAALFCQSEWRDPTVRDDAERLAECLRSALAAGADYASGKSEKDGQ